MEISIQVFEALDAIAKRYNISDVDWAEAANIRRPTIPELRRLSRSYISGSKDLKLNRICSLEKMIKLYSGLRIKLGNATVNEALKKVINGEPDQYMRLQMLILILKHEKKEAKDKAEDMLRKLIS